jgi:hypothetical protein
VVSVGYEGEGSVCVGSEVGAAEVEDGEAVAQLVLSYWETDSVE